MLAELGGDFLERSTLPERVLNLQTFEIREVLVLHLIGSFSCAMRNCNGGKEESRRTGRMAD